MADVKATKAQQACATLKRWGLRDEEVAVALRVSVNTIIRWRGGVMEPHPGHMSALIEYVEAQRAKRSKKHANAA
jgi:hypothetical protein